MAVLFSKRFRLNDCIEQSFFKTIIIITLVGCAIVLALDLFLVKHVSTNIHLMLLLIQVLCVILYGIQRINFCLITTGGLLMMCALFTYRGLITDEYNEITYTILITIGFMSSLVSRKSTGIIVKTVIFICLVVLLFKNYETVSTVLLWRKTIPYLVIFSIVTICSGILKSRYESNQVRLREMVDLLNNKNRKIKEQHLMLKKNYRELTNLNENLENLISQKTEKITEKNKQLGEIAYANAHTIRGPLARILGLMNLAKLEPELRDDYYHKINDEALSMDEILLAVTKKIESNIHK